MSVEPLGASLSTPCTFPHATSGFQESVGSGGGEGSTWRNPIVAADQLPLLAIKIQPLLSWGCKWKVGPPRGERGELFNYFILFSSGKESYGYTAQELQRLSVVGEQNCVLGFRTVTDIKVWNVFVWLVGFF